MLRATLQLFVNQPIDRNTLKRNHPNYDQILDSALFAQAHPTQKNKDAFWALYLSNLRSRPPDEVVHILFGEPYTSKPIFFKQIPGWKRILSLGYEKLLKSYERVGNKSSDEEKTLTMYFEPAAHDVDFRALEEAVSLATEEINNPTPVANNNRQPRQEGPGLWTELVLYASMLAVPGTYLGHQLNLPENLFTRQSTPPAVLQPIDNSPDEEERIEAEDDKAKAQEPKHNPSSHTVKP